MRYTLMITVAILLFAGCKKDKFTTEPQLTYKSIKPNVAFSNLLQQVIPVLTVHVTDAEGDLGFIFGSDTSKLYIKNLLNNRQDSIILPNLATAAVKNFEGDIEVTLSSVLSGSTRPRPKTDTLYFEVYIKDFAKHKSNIIKTSDPVFYITP